ncbi:MAG: hypothetical protein ACFE8A_08345 [Candidatus Hodarchaeota archaeon]
MNFKALMIIAFFVVSMISIPTMVFGQEDEDSDEEDQAGNFKDFRGGFGGIFSENMGYGGDLIGRLFEILLLDGVDLEDDEEGDGIYVLSASDTETYTGEYDFAKEGDTEEIHYLPFVDYLSHNETFGTQKWHSPDGINDYNETHIDGFAYCRIEKSGGFDYDLLVGAALTLIIWDYDGSFIEAAQKVLSWAEKFDEDEDDPEVIAEGIEVLTWLLVHINDIFTGDELFVFNPIVWQQLDITPWNSSLGKPSDFNITKTWYDTGDDNEIDGDDIKIKDKTYPPIDGQDILDDWLANATGPLRDSYMQWLLNDTIPAEDVIETIWTQFSFDIAQLWMKEFYIEIDMSKVDEINDDDDVEEVFGGCEIEFFLFTHHLAGVFLYNDDNEDEKITVAYDYLRNESADLGPDGKHPIIYTNGTAAMIPTSNEVTHQLILGTVGGFSFDEPDVKDDTVKWGLSLSNANVSAVPVGVDLNSYLNAPQEQLDTIFFGLEFETDMEDPDDEGEIEAEGKLKLDTYWAEWNDGNGPNNQDVEQYALDMAIIYVSTVLHFELDMDKDDEPDDPDDEYLDEQDYSSTTHTLKVGDYIEEDAEDKLDFVDIAGPYYSLINSSGSNIIDQATTSIIPVALWEGEHVSHGKYAGEEETPEDENSSDIDTVINAKWSIVLYAVCYPGFNGTGMGILHDPIFNVYMVFTPETAGFWALILLIAGIGLAGVATILIKRRKDRKF